MLYIKNFSRVTVSLMALFFLILLNINSVFAQSITPDFASEYSIENIGVVPGVPFPYGGLAFSDEDTLIIGGGANSAFGKLYTIKVNRDGQGRIIGFEDSAEVYRGADATIGEYNDGGVVFGPNGVLFTARWPINGLGQTLPEAKNEARTDSLGEFNVASSIAALSFVPEGFPNSGALKIVSWSGGQWYDLNLEEDGAGTYNILGAERIDIGSADGVQNLPGGPEGFLYISEANPLFDQKTLLVADFSSNTISAYDIDENADPIVDSRKIFATNVNGAEGAVIDPVTGDFLFSTFSGDNTLYKISGFTPPFDPLTTLRDVSVKVYLPNVEADYDASSANTSPSSMTEVDDSLVLEWNYPTFTIDQLENLDFDIALKNLKGGTKRVVVEKISLSYTDPNGTPVFQELGEQVVDVLPSVFDLALSLNKVELVPSEDLVISPTISNLSNFSGIANVRFEIRDNRDNVVIDLGRVSNVQLAENQVLPLSDIIFSTTNTLVGDYKVVAELIDSDGNFVANAEAKFKLVVSNGEPGVSQITLRTQTDRVVYHVTDVVEIGNLIQNLSKNTIVQDARLLVEVRNELDEIVHDVDKPLSDLTPLYSNQVVSVFNFVDMPEGDYRVIGRVVSSQGESLAESETGYKVKQDLQTSLAGDVVVSAKSVQGGDSLTCIDTVINQSIKTVSGLSVRSLLFNMDNGSLLQSKQYAVDLDSNQKNVDVRGINTSGFVSGVYACAVQALINDQWSTLAVDTFKVRAAVDAVDDELYTRRGAWGTIDVLANDSIKANSGARIDLQTQPEHGRLVEVDIGVFNYFPSVIYLGQDRFTYRLSDGSGGMDEATVRIDVGPGISCSFVPNHDTTSSDLVSLPRWARTKGDISDPPRYKIKIMSTADMAAFAADGKPRIDYPDCTLSYKPKAGIRKEVIVEYQVVDVATNGEKYTSSIKSFKLMIDTSAEANPNVVIVPILKLLLLDDEQQLNTK